MVRRSTWWTVLAAILPLAGCQGVGPYGADSPAEVAPPRVEAADAIGDLFPGPGSFAPAPPDLVGLTAEMTGETIEIELRFREPVSAELASPAAFGGFIDLDVDQDPRTGGEGAVDIFRPEETPATGLGVEFIVNLELGGHAFLFDVERATETARLDLRVDGTRATVRIPLSALDGDDGRLNLAAIVGNRVDATDRIPDSGHLRLGSGP